MVIARDVDEVLAALRADPKAELLAGGTDLMVEVNFGRKRVTNVIALDRVDELRQLDIAARVRVGAGVTYTLVPDAAAAGLVAAGRVDAILVPADRVAANGDVAAPIGSYGLAAAAAQRGIPFLVCATIGSLDTAVATGAELPVGAREVADLIRIGEAAHAPTGAGVLAPVDDVIPAGHMACHE